MKNGPVCSHDVHRAMLQSLGNIDKAALGQDAPFIVQPQLDLAAKIPWVFRVAAVEGKNLVEVMGVSRRRICAGSTLERLSERSVRAVKPGQMAFTRMPDVAHSRAAVFVRAISPLARAIWSEPRDRLQSSHGRRVHDGQQWETRRSAYHRGQHRHC